MKDIELAPRYAAMFAALGHEARVRIVRLLLAAHPDGLVAGEIQQEVGIPASTLRSEEHTSELQSLAYLVCRLLLEKKKPKTPSAASSRYAPEQQDRATQPR